MGSRQRSGEKVAHRKLIATMHEDAKRFSRARAERALRAGVDPTAMDSKGKGLFTAHPNYHIRALAWRKMGMPLPEDEQVRADFLKSIHVKEVEFAKEKQEELEAALTQ